MSRLLKDGGSLTTKSFTMNNPSKATNFLERYEAAGKAAMMSIESSHEDKYRFEIDLRFIISSPVAGLK